MTQRNQDQAVTIVTEGQFEESIEMTAGEFLRALHTKGGPARKLFMDVLLSGPACEPYNSKADPVALYDLLPRDTAANRLSRLSEYCRNIAGGDLPKGWADAPHCENAMPGHSTYWRPAARNAAGAVGLISIGAAAATGEPAFILPAAAGSIGLVKIHDADRKDTAVATLVAKANELISLQKGNMHEQQRSGDKIVVR